MWLPIEKIKKSYLYSHAEMWFSLYIFIVSTIISIKEMIVRAIFPHSVFSYFLQKLYIILDEMSIDFANFCLYCYTKKQAFNYIIRLFFIFSLIL